MEKRIVISLIIAFTALTGCSSDKNASEPVALDYVNIFVNGSDMEAILEASLSANAVTPSD